MPTEPRSAAPRSTANTPAEDEPPNSFPVGSVAKSEGSKRTVVVGKFDTTGAFTQNYEEWDVRGGLAAMLTIALMESKQLIVLGRAVNIRV